MDSLGTWSIFFIFLGVALLVSGNAVAIVFRKPGVTISDILTGPPDQPAITGVWSLKRIEPLVQPSKFAFAYSIALVGAAIVVIGVLLLVWRTIRT